MDFVLDANILFAALIRDSHTRHIILISDNNFYIPEFFFEELKNKIDELTEKTNLAKEKLEEILLEMILSSGIKIVPKQEIDEFMEKATFISPDPDDIPYFALALKLACPIWSNDGKLKDQNVVRIYNTKEFTEK